MAKRALAHRLPRGFVARIYKMHPNAGWALAHHLPRGFVARASKRRVGFSPPFAQGFCSPHLQNASKRRVGFSPPFARGFCSPHLQNASKRRVGFSPPFALETLPRQARESQQASVKMLRRFYENPRQSVLCAATDKPRYIGRTDLNRVK